MKLSWPDFLFPAVAVKAPPPSFLCQQTERTKDLSLGITPTCRHPAALMEVGKRRALQLMGPRDSNPVCVYERVAPIPAPEARHVCRGGYAQCWITVAVLSVAESVNRVSRL